MPRMGSLIATTNVNRNDCSDSIVALTSSTISSCMRLNTSGRNTAVTTPQM